MVCCHTCVQVVLPPGGLEYSGGESGWKEYILEDDECPLAILLQQLPHQGIVLVDCRTLCQ
jgi:hypothetical protein